VRRRDSLVALLALCAARLPPHAFAQGQMGVRRVGYLIASMGSDFPVLHDALRRGLGELGYVDGQNVQIIVRSAQGNADRYPALVAELVHQAVDVIFASNTSAAVAAKAGAPAIPLVFAGVGDPVGLNLVKSLPRPGGNVTGIALLTPELTSKRLELLKEAAPLMTRVSVLWNAGIRGHAAEIKSLEGISRSLRVQLHPVSVQRPEELDAAFSSMTRERTDALVVLASPLHHRNLRRIADLALEHRLPAICEFSEFASVGGLMVYGPSWPDMYRHAATYVAKILKGTAPSDLPVEQPTKIELVVNRTTARLLGIAIPQSLLLRADRVIQ
jgi:putative tryptophan/tyrosine transport system substrate-binding protein